MNRSIKANQMKSYQGHNYEVSHSHTHMCDTHSCSNHSNLEMEAEYLMKNLTYLNLNISRTKNGINKL